MVTIAQLKKVLDDVVNQAFAYETKKEVDRYKRYRLVYEKRDTISVTGRYSYTAQKVFIYSKADSIKEAVRAALPLVAHHIDWCKTKTIDSNARTNAFYSVYTDLVYAVLDMKILTKTDFEKIWAPDSSQVNFRIVEQWRPHYVEYDLADALNSAPKYTEKKGKTETKATPPPADFLATLQDMWKDDDKKPASKAEPEEPARQETQEEDVPYDEDWMLAAQEDAEAMMSEEDYGRDDYEEEAHYAEDGSPFVVVTLLDVFKRREEVLSLHYELKFLPEFQKKGYQKYIRESEVEEEEELLQERGFARYRIGKKGGARDHLNDEMVAIRADGYTKPYVNLLHYYGFTFYKGAEGRFFWRQSPRSLAAKDLERMQNIPQLKKLKFAIIPMYPGMRK